MKLLHPDDRERVLALVDHCNRTAEPFRAEYRLVSRDGRAVWVQDESLVVCDEDGRPLFTQGYLLDVTERRRPSSAWSPSRESPACSPSRRRSAEATPRITAVVCDALGWESGTLWLLDRERESCARATRSACERRGTRRPRLGARAPLWEARRAGQVRRRRSCCGRSCSAFSSSRGAPESRTPNLQLTVGVIASQLAQFVERKRPRTKLGTRRCTTR